MAQGLVAESRSGKSIRDSEEEIEELKLLVSLEELAGKTLPKRVVQYRKLALLGIVVLLGLFGTGAIWSRVPSVAVHVQISAKAVQFSSAESSLVMYPLKMDVIGVHPIDEVFLSRGIVAGRVIDGAAEFDGVKLERDPTDDSSAIALGPIDVIAGDTVSVRIMTPEGHVRLKTTPRSDLRLAMIGRGTLTMDSALTYDGRPPRSVRLRTTPRTPVNVYFKTTERSVEFAEELQIGALSFNRLRRVVAEAATGEERVRSSILSGTITLPAFDDRRLDIWRAQRMTFEGVDGVLTGLRISGDSLVVTYQGTLKKMELSVGRRAYNLKPTVLEWLVARHQWWILWGALGYLVTLVYTLYTRWSQVSHLFSEA